MAEAPPAEAAQPEHGAGEGTTAESASEAPAETASNGTTSLGNTATPDDSTQDEQQHSNAARGRNREIIAEDARFTKKAISPSPSRSSLSAALHAHASPMGALSPSGGSGANTPADMTTEEQLERLKLKVTDLASQVTSLNGKLVASYNRVGNLEDEADQKVMEIRTLTSKVEKLEAERKIWEDKYEGGLLVEKVGGHIRRTWRRSVYTCQPALNQSHLRRRFA